MHKILLSFIFLLSAREYNSTTWEEWKKDVYKEAIESPTSFLNAIQMNSQATGTLYLILGNTPQETRWVKDKPKDFYIEAVHEGSRIRVKEDKKESKYATTTDRRVKIKLKNGAIAEVVLGRRNAKLWAYIYDPQQIKKFTGFRFYPYNSQAVIEGYFKAHPPKFVSYKTVQGDPTKVSKVGTVSFMFQGVETYLNAYSWQEPDEPLKSIALIFIDPTAGVETYAGGRELAIKFNEPLKDGQKIIMDFNRTSNFYCAHSPFWHCPTGLQQKINVAVKAGEMLPLKKIVGPND